MEEESVHQEQATRVSAENYFQVPLLCVILVELSQPRAHIIIST